MTWQCGNNSQFTFQHHHNSWLSWRGRICSKYWWLHYIATLRSSSQLLRYKWRMTICLRWASFVTGQHYFWLTVHTNSQRDLVIKSVALLTPCIQIIRLELLLESIFWNYGTGFYKTARELELKRTGAQETALEPEPKIFGSGGTDVELGTKMKR